jgi:acyl dehydratase
MSALQTALTESEKLIGTEVGVSKWITVDQKMIDDFAKTTQDEQWIHVDPERAAAETPLVAQLRMGS